MHQCSRAQAPMTPVRSACSALAEGMKLYRSQNGVLLCAGLDGVIPPRFFKRVVSMKTKVTLWADVSGAWWCGLDEVDGYTVGRREWGHSDVCSDVLVVSIYPNRPDTMLVVIGCTHTTPSSCPCIPRSA